MITYSKLGVHGNIGNSMFQYAVLLSLGKSKGYEVKIPLRPSYFDINYNCMNRSIAEGFIIKTPSITIEELGQMKLNVYNERWFHYDSKVLEQPDNTDLAGYFQSEKYFIHNKNYIIDNFQFKPEIKEQAVQLFKQLNIEPENTTSLHLRRGDYVHKQEHHPLMPQEYYIKACKSIKTKYYLIFSDDIEWCKQAFAQDSRVFFSTLTNPFEDMCAMSMCAHNIIANSSFSWWAAWLNINPKKIVVGPKKWFGPAYEGVIDPKDVIPESWLKI
jgi:hypothetical protein